MMLDLLLALKFVLTVAVVLGVSWVAERFSPRIAGILTGLPTGTPIILFFYGLEQGAQFAADTTVYNLVGFIAGLTQFFIYYKASAHFRRHGLLLSLLASLATYFLVAFGLRQIVFTPVTAALALGLAIAFFLYLYKDIPNVEIRERVKLTKHVLAFRACMAAGMVVAVTGVAQLVGTTWAGLLSALSVTTVPLILILHYTYGVRPVHTIIKNFPVGLPTILAYNLTVYYAFPLYGIYWGTLMGYATTAVYLVAYTLAKKKWPSLP